MPEPVDVTGLLRELAEGQPDALDRLVPLVYEEMRRIAHGQLRRERVGHTLETTALVHETYLKLVGVRHVDWQDRAHFFSMAGRVMRRVLVDYARARNRVKRGGGVETVVLSEVEAPMISPDKFLELDEALTRLETLSPRQCRVVECRCFAGLTVEETARTLDASTATVKRDWAFARAWLNRELDGTLESREAP